jgi:hypothetical protein
MESNFSLFRTSLKCSMYNNNNNNNNKCLNINTAIDATTDKNELPLQSAINMTFKIKNPNSFHSINKDEYEESKKKTLITSSSFSPKHSYGYISLSQSQSLPYNSSGYLSKEYRNHTKHIFNSFDEKKSNIECKNIQKPNSVLKKSNSQNCISKGKKITFNNYNNVILVAGKEFYINNNIKNDVWWSSKELNFIRNMCSIEIARIQRNNPKMSPTECIKEMCKRT